jgi:hypothetical protein
VNSGDVGMIELREDQSFFVEMLACGCIGERTGRKDFDGNITGEALVAGAKDLSHAASADLLDDAVVAQLVANEQILACRPAGHDFFLDRCGKS